MSATETYFWLITGANRGIGLELTRQLLASNSPQTSHTILATCRSPSKATALTALAHTYGGRIHILQLDITDPESVRACFNSVRAILDPERGIDYLINNAAINASPWDTAFTLRPETLERHFATNVIAPARITQIFLPLVARSAKKTVVNVSSTLGSLGADVGGANTTSYAVGKAALNMVTYKQQKERPDIVFISICPGWLKTDMGGPDAPEEVSVGIAGVLKTLEGLTPADSGKFYDYRGAVVPW
ncbi:NAD-P-binding protein [Trametes maxima]|nr:NAD-P-binding protein [Trametes maxima]